MATERSLALIAAILGATGVAAGAFGSHALKTRLSPDLLAVYQTGAQYHLLHAVALLALAGVAGRLGSLAAPGGWSIAAGTVVFSGSLYILAVSGVRAWGAVTPVGGLLLIVGWSLVAAAALK